MKKSQNRWNKLLLALLLLLSTIVEAQNSPSYFSKDKPVSITATGVTTNGATFVATELVKPIVQGAILNEKTTSAKLYLKLDLGEDFVGTEDADIDYVAQFDVLVGGTTFSQTKNLTISAGAPEAILVVELSSYFNDPSNVPSNIEIQNTSFITKIATPTLTANYVSSNIRLNATFIREYGVDVRLKSGNTMAPALLMQYNPNRGSTATGRLVKFEWETNNTKDFPNYEVQILRLYNTDKDKATSNASIQAEIDWNKALRVETQSSEKEITLTVAEGSGFYVWRVRPIGNFYPGGIANQQNYGVWNTSSLKQGDAVPLEKTTLGSRKNAFYVTDPDENINWIYNRVFTEGNDAATNEQGVKTSEGMSYADGLLRARQTQAYNSSNSTSLITQTVSDYSGRPALTTLPVPVTSGLDGYKIGFVQADDGSGGKRLYTALDYDVDDSERNKISDPKKIEQTGTDFSYYDGNNATGVANAEGYAFKRTLFKTDGTGRVDEESGVGKMHALGSVSGDGGGKTTRILFGTPSDDELIRIFGDEAPLAESVIKTMTIDPNEVVSVTYTSKEGKTIATALITESTTNLKELDNENIQSLPVKNTANQNIVSNSKMISSRRIALEQAKDVTLSYKNTNSYAMTACAGGECELKLRFYLNDLKNGATYVSDAVGGGVEIEYFNLSSQLNFTDFDTWEWRKLDDNSPTPPTVLTTTITGSSFNLVSGEYIITKEVFSTNSDNYIEEEILAYSEKYVPIINALADKISAIENETAYDNFQMTFMPNLKSKIDDYRSGGATTSNDLVALLVMDVDLVGKPASGTDPAIPPYVFPTDFVIPANFMDTDPKDPTQNTMNITLGCCESLAIPIPKPEICTICDGETKEVSGLPIATIQTDITDSINANVNGKTALLRYGVDDIRKNTNSVFNLGGKEWNDVYANGTGPEWNAINDIVGHVFMNYLYQKLATEKFIDTYAATPDPNKPYQSNAVTAYDVDNPNNYVRTDSKLQDFYDKFAPGFTNKSMQYMLTNMLISRYYVGQSKESPLNSGNYYRAKENQHGWLFFVDNQGNFIADATLISNVVTADDNSNAPFSDTPDLSLIVTGFDDGDEFNYDCKELYTCWLQAVDLINSIEFGDQTNIMDGFNEESGKSSDGHADDEESKEKGNPVLDLITSWVMSSKMRGFEEEAGMDKNRLEALVSFPKLFLECATNQFAAIIDQNTSLPNDYKTETPLGATIGDPGRAIKGDFSIGNSPFNNVQFSGLEYGNNTPILVNRGDEGQLLASNGNTVFTNSGVDDHIIETKCGTCAAERTLYYPYVLKPEWMFKYFVYNSYEATGSSNDFMPVLNQFESEVNACYQNLFKDICSNDPVFLSAKADNVNNPGLTIDNAQCGTSDCRYYHESWSTGQRLNFYKQISTARRCSETCNPLYEGIDVLNNSVVALSKADAVLLATAELDDAQANCDFRKAEFKSEIVAELEKGCWDIVECSSDPTSQITEAQIDEMVTKVVNKCKMEVNKVRTPFSTLTGNYGPSITTEFPKAVDKVCFFIELSNKSCVKTKDRTITLFPVCDQNILDQVNNWNFSPSITTAPGCTNYVAKEWVSCNIGQNESCNQKGCTHTIDNETITKTYSSQHTIPLQDNK